jgi:hypothetical protein
MKHAKVYLTLLAGLLVLSAWPAAARSSSSAQDDADQKELYKYVLTLNKVHQLEAAMRAITIYAGSHHGDSSGDDIDNAKTTDGMVRAIKQHPAYAALIAKNGLTPRQYAVGSLTLMQAWMAVGFKKSGTYKQYPPDVLKVVSPANLGFVEKHFDEINKAFGGGQGRR